jgi:hypothetical protein
LALTVMAFSKVACMTLVFAIGSFHPVSGTLVVMIHAKIYPSSTMGSPRTLVSLERINQTNSQRNAHRCDSFQDPPQLDDGTDPPEPRYHSNESNEWSSASVSRQQCVVAVLLQLMTVCCADRQLLAVAVVMVDKASSTYLKPIISTLTFF